MSDSRGGGRPEYKVYRARRRPLARLPAADLGALRRRLGRPRLPGAPGRPEGVTVGRVLRWLAVAVACWILISLGLFMLSAQLEKGPSSSAKDALGGGTLLTGSTILVLGSDQRIGESIDKTQRGPPRADSIMLVHVAFGSVRKLSIPRDAEAAIPGHGTQKINAAYAIGGARLMIDTVEDYLGNGLEVNHLIEVDFEDFPKLIDALGGISIDVKRKICSPPFDNFWKGLTIQRGEQHMDGTKALGFARVRTNTCAPNETDLDRARRQQEVFAGIRRQVVSPTTFFRLPWVSWRAPKAIRTDLRGPGLLALAADLASGGAGEPTVIQPSCLSCGVGSSLRVSQGAKRDAVDKLLGR